MYSFFKYLLIISLQLDTNERSLFDNFNGIKTWEINRIVPNQRSVKSH